MQFKALQDDIDVNGDAAKFVEKRDLKEEADYTPEHCGEDEHNEHILEDDEYDENNNDEDDGSNESEHPGEASISRKVWQFFTSWLLYLEPVDIALFQFRVYHVREIQNQ